MLIGDDIPRLAVVFDAMREMRMPIGAMEPEKVLVKERKLLPDVYDRSGYAIGVTFGVGDAPDPAKPLSFDVTFDTPHELEPFALDDVRARLAAGGVPLPPTWRLADDIAPHILHISADDVRPHTSTELARFLLAGLRSLGAATPTDRWDCQWQIGKRDEIPAP